MKKTKNQAPDTELTNTLKRYTIISIKVKNGVIYMQISETILDMAEKNNGTVASAMITKAGISRGNLKHLVDKGMLEKVARGVYILPDVWEDEFFSIQSRYKRGIFSGETALFLWDLTDRTPINFSMTFPASYNVSKVKKENIQCSMVKEPYYSLGITSVQTPENHNVMCYSMEKTLCDILKPRARTDIQVISEAYKRYVKRSDKNIMLLSEFARQLGVERRIRAYLEVLL